MVSQLRAYLLISLNFLEFPFNYFADHVEFGEVAMAPPSLTAKPRKADITDLKPRVISYATIWSVFMTPQ